MAGAMQASQRRLTAEQRRHQLLAVALELFAHRGYRATTMDDIAEAAGGTKPLLYQHFSSKRALYLELVDSIAQDLLTAIGRAVMQAEGPRQQVELGFAAYFRLVVRHEDELRLLDGRHPADDLELGRALRAVEDAIAEAIDPLIDAGLDDDHRRLLAYGIVGMAEGVSRRFMAQRPDSEAEVDEEARKLAGRAGDPPRAGLAPGRPPPGRGCARSTPTDGGAAQGQSAVTSVRHNAHSSSTHAA